MNRTLEDFVEDMVSNGADSFGVRAVASQTRWRDRKQEAQELAKKLEKRQKKGRILLPVSDNRISEGNQ